MSSLFDEKVFFMLRSHVTNIKKTTFDLHAAQKVKVENEWEFADLKLNSSFCYSFV